MIETKKNKLKNLKIFKVFQVKVISTSGRTSRQTKVIKHTEPLPDNAIYPMLITGNKTTAKLQYKKML